MRYFIEFAYDGTDYFGYQIQPKVTTVQETIEHALSLILRTPIEIVAAGRTDRGVHASKMYAHFEYDKTLDKEVFIKKLNSFLPKDISFYNLIEVHPEAHARFDATARTYRYYIHQKKNPFKNKYSWQNHLTLDINLMNEACQILFKHIDFECFSKVHTDVNTFNCKITEAVWTKISEDELVFKITADRFLRNMVRAIVGTMVDVGTKKISIEDFEKIIISKNRSQAGFSVPAQGLFLEDIKYPYIP